MVIGIYFCLFIGSKVGLSWDGTSKVSKEYLSNVMTHKYLCPPPYQKFYPPPHSSNNNNKNAENDNIKSILIGYNIISDSANVATSKQILQGNQFMSLLF